VQGVKRLSFSDRLKQNAADAKKRRYDAKGSTIASSRLKPFNEQDIAIAMSHATSATFAEQGITHMQFAWAAASNTHIADITLSVKRFQYHEQWAKWYVIAFLLFVLVPSIFTCSECQTRCSLQTAVRSTSGCSLQTAVRSTLNC
jgi:hypothetical protein